MTFCWIVESSVDLCPIDAPMARSQALGRYVMTLICRLINRFYRSDHAFHIYIATLCCSLNDGDQCDVMSTIEYM